VSPVGELIESYGISYHQFADDKQLLVTMNSTDVSPAIDSIDHCSAAVRRWFLLNGLQLNAGKSEVVFLGTAAQLRSVADVTTVDVAINSLQLAPPLKSLGVIIDSRLRFDSHARNVTRACNLHIRALLHVRVSPIDDVAQTVACSIVSSRLDYCNALLCGAPEATFNKLQPCQGRLPMWRMRRHRPAAQVPPLASSEAAGHVQGRTDNLQGAPHSNAGVSQRSVADPRAGMVAAIILGSNDGHPTDEH